MMGFYGIFPEGTRKGLIKTGEIKKGSILIGIKKKVPVIIKDPGGGVCGRGGVYI